MLIPATVHMSSRETSLEVLCVDEREATLLYVLCETCGWDSRRDPDGDNGLFDVAVGTLADIMLFHSLE